MEATGPVLRDLNRLRRDLQEYQRLTGKTAEEVMRKQGAKLGKELYRQLRKQAPAKGEIRAAAMQALEDGRGVRVRESVRQRIAEKVHVRTDLLTRATVFGGRRGRRTTRRGLNLQALMVQGEIALRERGRGFLSVTVPQARFDRSLRKTFKAWSKYGPMLAEAQLAIWKDGAKVNIGWGGGLSNLSGQAAAYLSSAAAYPAISEALKLTALDIEKHLADLARRDLKKAFGA